MNSTMMTRNHARRWCRNAGTITALCASALLVAAGCSTTPELVPVNDSGAASGTVERVDGVSFEVRAGAWSGDPDIRDHVVPIRVDIRNQGDRPVKIGYGQFALVTSDGTMLGAIPPLRVKGSESDRRVVTDLTIDPAFNYSGFYAAPYYGGLYPGVPTFTGDYYFDSYYYDTYDTYWIDTELPTPGMLARALPDGRLEPGGQVRGYLYFESLPGDVSGQVTFRADLINAETGKAFGEISIPYRVQRG